MFNRLTFGLQKNKELEKRKSLPSASRLKQLPPDAVRGSCSSDPGNDGGSGVRLFEGTVYVCRAREERLGTRAHHVSP